jgi:hypothetical protein
MPKTNFDEQIIKAANASPSFNFKSGSSRNNNTSCDPTNPGPNAYFIDKEPISAAHLHKKSDDFLHGGSPNNILSV